MSFLDQVTPVVLTFNEAANIARCLACLRDFREVIVIDSGSTDETLALVAGFANTRVLTRPFDSFSGQWNFALREAGVATEWMMAMDADYLLTPAFLAELAALTPGDETFAYRLQFSYCVEGKPLSGTLYPPLIALYRHAATHYVQDGHCMRARVAGPVATLNARILHDDRKPLSRWLASQLKYADQECELLLTMPWRALGWQDCLRRLVFITPWLVPLYCLTVGRGLLDGRRGWYYALQRGIAETLLALRVIEAGWRRERKAP